MSQQCRECVRYGHPDHCTAFVDGRPCRCSDGCEWFEPHPMLVQRDRLLALLREAREELIDYIAICEGDALAVMADGDHCPCKKCRKNRDLLARIDAEIGGQPAEAPEPAGEVCRWDRPFKRFACGYRGDSRMADGTCPGCGRRVEVVG